MLIGSAHGAQRLDTPGSDGLERIDSQIRNLHRQIKQVEKDKSLSKQDKEDKIRALRAQVSQLEQQKAQVRQQSANAKTGESAPAPSHKEQEGPQAKADRSMRPNYDSFESVSGGRRDGSLYSATREEDGRLRIIFHNDEDMEAAGEEPVPDERDPDSDVDDFRSAEDAKRSRPGNASDGPNIVIAETERHCFCEGNKHNRETGQDCYVQIVSMKTPDGKPVDSPETGRKIPLNDLPNQS